MIRVMFARVRDHKVERVRAWLRELDERGDEVRETFAAEGVRQEQGYLLSVDGVPVLAYVMDVDDPERAREVFAASTLPIDVEHRQVVAEVLAGNVEAELLYDVRAAPE
jgi:succinate dehydrogenase/fumarate reductase flavoprotein subunit